MANDPARSVDPRFPGLSPEVTAGYLAAPENVNAEVLDGELFLQPRPRPRHSLAGSRLATRLSPFSDPDEGKPCGWAILFEPELHLGRRPDIVDPDLAGWRLERMPTIPDEAAMTLPPAWACEVL